MNGKLQKVMAEIEKVKAKIAAQQTHLRELEQQKTELENTEIVETVRGMDISLADLAAMLRAAHVTSGQVGPKSETTDKEATKE